MIVYLDILLELGRGMGLLEISRHKYMSSEMRTPEGLQFGADSIRLLAGANFSGPLSFLVCLKIIMI